MYTGQLNYAEKLVELQNRVTKLEDGMQKIYDLFTWLASEKQDVIQQNV